MTEPNATAGKAEVGGSNPLVGTTLFSSSFGPLGRVEVEQAPNPSARLGGFFVAATKWL